MVPGRIKTKHPAIEHVGQPGKWMPISALAVNFGKGPDDALRGEAAIHEPIGRDVIRIVVVDEIVRTHRRIEQQRAQQQRPAD
jgi:hypothetical protein